MQPQDHECGRQEECSDVDASRGDNEGWRQEECSDVEASLGYNAILKREAKAYPPAPAQKYHTSAVVDCVW